MTTLGLRDLGFVGGLIGYDVDALTYITAVEAADGQSLETAVKDAINAFVIGCKSDGIWSAIKASCILAGARTLTGALVPLVGGAPTSINFVSADYNRKTGLKGNGSTKRILLPVRSNDFPQNDMHMSAYASAVSTSSAGKYPAYIGYSSGEASLIQRDQNNGGLVWYNRQTSSAVFAGSGSTTGLLVSTRSSSTQFTYSVNGNSGVASRNSATPGTGSFYVFDYGDNFDPSNATIGFYSVGLSLSASALTTRATTLLNAIAAAIP